MEVSGQLHAPPALLPGKEPLLPVGEEVGWAPEPVWMRWRRVKFPAPAGTRTPDYPARSPVLTELSLSIYVSSNLRLGFPSGLFSIHVFRLQFYMHFSSLPCVLLSPLITSSLIWSFTRVSDVPFTCIPSSEYWWLIWGIVSCPSSAEIKNEWSFTCSSYLRLHAMVLRHGGNFTH